MMATLLRRCSERNPTSPCVLLRTILNTITCSCSVKRRVNGWQQQHHSDLFFSALETIDGGDFD